MMTFKNLMYIVVCLYAANAPICAGAKDVTVIGGGLGGMLVSNLLSKFKDKEGNRIYDIVILEKEDYVMRRASSLVARLHLGGEYPSDFDTAQFCLNGAILFRQMFKGVYTRVPGTFFGVTADTSMEDLGEGSISIHYDKIREAYQQIYNSLPAKTQSDVGLGSPDHLYIDISPTELEQFQACSGFREVIYTAEKGVNPVYLGTLLEEEARRAGIEQLCGRCVGSIDPYESDLSKLVVTSTGKSDLTPIVTDIVINASGGSAALASEKLTHIMRGMVLADISECVLPTYNGSISAFFGLMGEGGGMFCPLNKKIAFLYNPSSLGCYIETRIDEAPRKAHTLTTLKARYTFLQRAKPIHFLINPLVTGNGTDWKKRRHVPITCECEGRTPMPSAGESGHFEARSEEAKYAGAHEGPGSPPVSEEGRSPPSKHIRIDLILTKGTFAPLGALQTVQHILRHTLSPAERQSLNCPSDVLDWIESFDPMRPPMQLPPFFSIGVAEASTQEFRAKARLYARNRGLPEELVDSEEE